MVSIRVSPDLNEWVTENVRYYILSEGLREVIREVIRSNLLPIDIIKMREISRLGTYFCNWLGVPVIENGIISNYYVAFRNPLIVGYFGSTTYMGVLSFRLFESFTQLFFRPLQLTPFSFINYVRLFLTYGYRTNPSAEVIIKRYGIDFGTWMRGYCLSIDDALFRLKGYLRCVDKRAYLDVVRYCYGSYAGDVEGLYRCMARRIEDVLAYIFTASLELCGLGSKLVDSLTCEGEGGR